MVIFHAFVEQTGIFNCYLICIIMLWLLFINIIIVLINNRLHCLCTLLYPTNSRPEELFCAKMAPKKQTKAAAQGDAAAKSTKGQSVKDVHVI